MCVVLYILRLGITYPYVTWQTYSTAKVEVAVVCKVDNSRGVSCAEVVQGKVVVIAECVYHRSLHEHRNVRDDAQI